MDAYRPMPFPPWWAISTLRPSMPSQRPQVPVSRDIAADPNLGEASSEALTAAPEAAEVKPVWQALLDISVYRRRPWFWRLAASLRFFRP
jgi:hypothetical protein